MRIWQMMIVFTALMVLAGGISACGKRGDLVKPDDYMPQQLAY